MYEAPNLILSAKNSTVLGVKRLSLPSPAVAQTGAGAPWEQEIGDFGKLTLDDMLCALNSSQTMFFPMVFWADHAIVAKFPTLAALARG